MQRFLRCLAAAAIVLPAVGGCYHFVPLEEASRQVAEGRSVRVHLSAPRSFEVSGYTAHDIRRLDGSLIERSSDAWVVAATSMYGMGGNRFEAGSFALDVPASAIAAAEVRTHSWWRTAVASVAGVVGIYFLSEMLQGTSTGGSGGPGDGDSRSVIPVP
jgi:hypothetical protein